MKKRLLTLLMALSLQTAAIAAPLDDLISAASLGDIRKIESALKRGADINGYLYDLEVGYDFTSPALVQAAEGRHLEAARFLLGRGADPNAGVFGWTALQAAVQGNDLKMAQLLLEFKADPEKGLESDSMGKAFYNEGGQTALMRAAAAGQAEMVKLLLRYKANPLTRDAEGLDSLMHAFTSKQKASSELFKLLLAAKYNFASDGSYLSRAAMSNRTDVCELLLARGAKINHPDAEGETPLSKALLHGSSETIRYFLAKGANPFLKTAQNRPFEELLEINSEAGSVGLQLLTEARRKRLDSVRARIKARSELDKPDDSGWTPLFYTVAARDLELTNQLLSKSVNPDLRDSLGQTALMYAIGTPALVERLVIKGARIDLQNHKGRTALMLAADTGDIESTRILLRRSPRLNLKDEGGFTALALAIFGGHEELAALLRSKGAKAE